jgi:transposase-like protein
MWFFVMWLMMAQKTGISSKNFQDTFGFGSCQTAWGWLQKLRGVMVVPGRDLLSGRVEVGGTYIGGQKHGARGRGAEGKTLVLAAVEAEGTKVGRVRLRSVEDAGRGTVSSFITDFIAPGATLATDGFKSYGGEAVTDVRHERHVLSTGGADAEKGLEHVHLVISLVKRWLMGTHQGATTPNHLQAYLNEYAFRFNRRHSSHRGKLFYRLMQQAATTAAPKTKDLYGEVKDAPKS